MRRPYGNIISSFQIICSDAVGEAAQLLPKTPFSINPGGQLVFTGTITTRAFSFDGNTDDVVIAGVSLTKPVPISMPVQPGNLDGFSAEQIVRGALAPHGIRLNAVNPPSIWSKPFPYFSVNPGESVANHSRPNAPKPVRAGCPIWDEWLSTSDNSHIIFFSSLLSL